jgi:LPXTG-motif cell wall-anchored protein
MKFTKILVAAYALIASFGAMAIDLNCTDPNGCPTGLGTPTDDLALLGVAVAALAAGVGIIRRKK